VQSMICGALEGEALSDQIANGGGSSIRTAQLDGPGFTSRKI
jgi:hypothetical protein